MSSVWEFYDKVENSAMAICLKCNKEYSYKTSITNLKKHLINKHPNVYRNNINKSPNDTIFIALEKANQDTNVDDSIEDPKEEKPMKIHKPFKAKINNHNTSKTIYVERDTRERSRTENTHKYRKREINEDKGDDYDEYDLYGQLIAKKLRKLEEKHRDLAMHEIDNIMFRMKMKNNVKRRNSVCSTPLRTNSPVFIVSQANEIDCEDTSQYEEHLEIDPPSYQ